MLLAQQMISLIDVAIAGVVILVFGGWLVGKITKD